MANALKEIGDGLSEFIETIKTALEDEAMRRLIAEDLGLPQGTAPPKPDLPQDKLDSIAAYRSQSNPDKEAFFQLLADVRSVYDSVRAFIAGLGVSGVSTINQVLYRLFDLFALNEVRVRAPLAFFIVQLLETIVEDSAEVPQLTTDDFAAERFLKALGLSLQFGISPLFYLFTVLSAKDTKAARRASDRLFPHLAGGLAYLQRSALDDTRLEYGWDGLNVPKKDKPLEFTRTSLTPRADELAERMLSIGFQFGQAPADGAQLREAIDLAFSIVPESDGPQVDPASILRQGGLLISVGGEGSVEIELSERWKFLVEASAKPAFSLFLSSGRPPRFTHGFGPNDLPLNIALVSVPDAQNVTYAFPNEDETRIEIGQLAFTFSYDGFKGGIKGELRRGAIVITTKDQDGFLSNFLPKDGLRVPFNFGVGFSTDQGFFTEGNVPLLSGRSTGPLLVGGRPRPSLLSSTTRFAPAAAAMGALGRGLTARAAAAGAPAGDGSAPPATLSSAKQPELGLETIIAIGKALLAIRLDKLTLALRPSADPAKAQAKAEVSVSFTLHIGPIEAVVERLGFEVGLAFPETGGNAGFADFSIGFKPPSGVGLKVDAPAVSGGGFLYLDYEKGQYAGFLQLAIEGGISVKAVGIITTRLPDGKKGYSFLIMVTVENFTPIQLGLGFALTGIGGLIAINRTVDQDVLREGIKTKMLNDILFPKDPIRNAPQIFGTLNRVFPPREGSFLFGPVVQICWFTPPLVTMDLAVILELGRRTRLIVLGRVSAILPSEKADLIRLQMNVVGILDFDEKSLSLDAALYDSRLAGKFPLTGSMAMRVNWGAKKEFALAVGGFHPAFKPPPAFPALERIAISFADSESFRLRVEGYFALTANTVQWGARAELFAKAAGFNITGQIGYDVLIQVDPFGFIADFHASVQLRRGSTNLFKISVEGELRGPRPLHLKGKATFEIFWCDFSIHVDHTFVSGDAPPRLPPVRVMEKLKAALDDPRNWTGQIGESERAVVTLRQSQSPAQIALHPLGRLSVKQTVVPLELQISKFGAATPADARLFKINTVTLNGRTAGFTSEKDFFAPAQFVDLADEDKLEAPSFESMVAGATVGSDSFIFTASDLDIVEDPTISYETVIIARIATPPPPPPPAFAINPAMLARQIALGAAAQSDVRRLGPARYRPTAARNSQAAKGWTVVSAADQTRQAIPGVDPAKPGTYAQAFQAVEQLKKDDPARAKGLMLARVSS